MCDNAISWLEPTSKCNLHCDGCYRENRVNSHKSLAEIRHELEVFNRYRKTDSVSIAGGEPLLHPDIVEIVRMVKEFGWKPNINTNGIKLNPDLLKELKKAGVVSFTFHIDSGQGRPGWKDANEIELNEVRQQLADMVSGAGGITTAFNATVYPENLRFVPDLMKWSQENIDKVQVMVFILYRMAILGKDHDFYAGAKKVEFDDMMYSKKDDHRRTDISSPEMVNLIRDKYDPDYEPCAYLNGTEDPGTFKWLLAGRVGNRHKSLGWVGSKFMELIQSFDHVFSGTYLSYAKLSATRRGRLMFLLSPLDKGIRKIASNYFGTFRNTPSVFFGSLHYQSVMIIQPADISPDGRVNMCDGCPDITVWNDQLIWSCRMEEQYRWGQNVRAVPKK